MERLARGGLRPAPARLLAPRPGSRPRAAGFEPILLLDLELSGPEICTPVPRRSGAVHRRARVLVRLHGAPLGVIDVTLDGAGVDMEMLVEHASDSLGAAIDAHLSYDGLLAGKRARSALLRSAASPRCVQERRAFAASAPLASVVIATRDRPESLDRTLAGALAMEYPCFEVIVVDSAPATSATRLLVERHRRHGPHLRYVRESLAGLAVAHNRGLEVASGAIVAFTDDDVLLDPFWLLELARAFERAEDVACATGLILPAELETPAQVWLEDHVRLDKGCEPRLFDLGPHRPEGKLFPYTAGALGSGANMAFRADALRALGGFDPAIGTGTLARGGDDLAAFFAVIAAGHTLAYQPTAIVRHSHRRTPEDLRAQMFSYGAGLGAFLTKVVVDDPLLLPGLAWRIPFGAGHAVRLRPPGSRAGTDGLPGDLVTRERLGMLVGPLGYLIERRRRRALYKRPAPGVPRHGPGVAS